MIASGVRFQGRLVSFTDHCQGPSSGGQGARSASRYGRTIGGGGGGVLLDGGGGLGGPDAAARFTTRSARNTELLVVDEADRLKTPSLEQIRDHYDRTGVGVVLIGMPGIEKSLARYPQLYSRVGFVHHYRPLSPNEQHLVIARHWPHLALDDLGDFTTAEAVATITRITSGNFRLTSRLVAQIERVMDINQSSTVTAEVVETARESLVVGVL